MRPGTLRRYRRAAWDSLLIVAAWIAFVSLAFAGVSFVVWWASVVIPRLLGVDS